ncbi:predicted transcription regulator, containing DNA-binding HTH domain [Thermococcus kodakarensis KOD1]|uniref:Predicted transcription regulator, containing DNA-binding HTH domain n=1 Tax=Thermococcus kodakarensis (strain ATCC BAA-918 / JCM 12380 / KOD1) TaxID=69014 RepID=Q5JIZ6_THEKO|nr:helix-turn-helix domain-containing protein [Thermococcus kodakarensis]WCN27610.1 helix-turn-helix domain-containing protein [Thermococcus kodakarensis]WCN29901.1 helix-turn-helix domain-containing protein [Thermococcus kodakarensis]BAD85877.1 predicted transcription regulator, containing DNA-binding HTH domain [Thermococcus kodakarensis KOD1]
MLEKEKEALAKRIAGEITLSSDPGKTMRKWREIFGISQTELADYLGVSSSVISDYEGGRRKSPGASTIRKFVEALIEIDEKRGGNVIRAFSKTIEGELPTDAILDIREFAVPVPIRAVVEAVKGEVAANHDLLDRKIYGYTVVDSIRAILEMSSEEFLKLYGWTTERALVFTKVTTGRSPMIAVRVQGLKPAVIVLHGVKRLDELAVKLAERERIPLVVSKASNENELINGLRKLVEKTEKEF